MTKPREIVLPEAPRPAERGSVLDLLNFVLRHPFLIFGLPLLFGGLAPLISILNGARYNAESKFTSQQSESGGSRFAGIAAQFGIDVPGSASAMQPLDYSVELITSRRILRDAVLTNYTFAEDELSKRVRRGNLVQLYGIKARNPEAGIRAAIAKLKSNVSASPNIRSGLITLRTSAPWAGLAVEINQRLLDLTDEFNLQKRQSHAAAERKFVDDRMNAAADELSAAENQLKQFNQENRGFQGSFELQAEHQRLQRRVDLRQQIYLSLAQAYEQARVEELRNTPVITVIDPPTLASRIGGGLLTTLLLGLFAGLVVGVLVAFGKEYFQREAAADPRAAAELSRRFAQFRNRLIPFRRVHFRGR
jgi:uncharacterized protein involved in exopolysaccharide biosynthesis